MTREGRTFTVILEREEDGGYSVHCPSLPGCISQGDDRAEAMENIGEAIRLVLDVLEDDAAVNDESILRLQVLRGTLPYSETPDLIAGEMKRILADRKKDGLSYDGVSIERVEIPATAPV